MFDIGGFGIEKILLFDFGGSHGGFYVHHGFCC